MSVLSEIPADASIGDILFANPARYAPVLEFTQTLLRGESDLAMSDRELLAAYVSGLNECDFCTGVHTATAARFGVSETLLEGLLANLDTAEISVKTRALLLFARKLTLTPAKVVDADRQAVVDAGHSEQTLRDVIGITALFGFFNRLVDGHGVSGNAAIFTRDSEMLHGFGYGLPPNL